MKLLLFRLSSNGKKISLSFWTNYLSSSIKCIIVWIVYLLLQICKWTFLKSFKCSWKFYLNLKGGVFFTSYTPPKKTRIMSVFYYNDLSFLDYLLICLIRTWNSRILVCSNLSLLMAKLIHVYVGNSSSEINWNWEKQLLSLITYLLSTFYQTWKWLWLGVIPIQGQCLFIASIKFSCVLLFTAIFFFKNTIFNWFQS